MPISEERARKIGALIRATPKAPLPFEPPKIEIMEDFRARFPEQAARLDEFNESLDRFLKENSNR